MAVHETPAGTLEGFDVVVYGEDGRAIFEADQLPTAAEAGYSTGEYARTYGVILTWDDKGLFKFDCG